MAKNGAIQLALPGSIPAFPGCAGRGRVKTYSADEFVAAWNAAKAAVEARHPYRPARHKEIYTEMGLGKTAYFGYLKDMQKQPLKLAS